MGCSKPSIDHSPESPPSDVLRLLETPSFEPLPLRPPPSPPPPTPLTLPALPRLDDISGEDLDFWNMHDDDTVMEGDGEIGDEHGPVNGEQENVGTVGIEQPIYASSSNPPMDCSGCDVLREVNHSNDSVNVKLEIHGGLGVVYHAIIVQYAVNGQTEQYTIDLSLLSLERVKQFLMDYSQMRQQEGLVLTMDTLSSFYDAICVKMSEGEATMSTNGSQMQPQPGPQQNSALVQSLQLAALPKTSIAAQRERTAKLQLKDIADYFHLPIADAAKELSICTTALKKICRRHDMNRWPHRKLKSISSKISKLEESLKAQTGEAAQKTSAEIDKLKETITRIREGSDK